MSNIDFEIFYKDSLDPSLNWASSYRLDVFISAFNSSERVQAVFEAVSAKRKIWLVCPEYGYDPSDYPRGECFSSADPEETEFVSRFVATAPELLSADRVCIDITGFIRPHLLFLLRWLFVKGRDRVDVLYSEPVHYRAKETTGFSLGGVLETRQVAGFEGLHSADTSRNLLIIGSGYDSLAIRAVSEAKNNARKVQIFGLPSLRADMYQENVIRANLAEDAMGEFSYRFAPAHDPFVTANVLQEVVADYNRQRSVTNLYLSPLATKAQVLGFALYYFACCEGSATSVIYPFSNRYERETTKGLSRIWKYSVELASLHIR